MSASLRRCTQALFLVATGSALAVASTLGAAEPAPRSLVRRLEIAPRAWAGSSVNVVANIRQSLFTRGRTQFAAFYDPEGRLILARRALGSDKWEVRPTAYTGRVADAHNSVSLAVDGEGTLHVAWDHHDSPIRYARGVAPGSLELGPPGAMTGESEARVTYPQFLALRGGDLLFLYRDGASGRGRIILDRYSLATHAWGRTQTGLIDGEGERSPYWSAALDRQGVIHLAWNWRDSPDVASNHDLAYARSADGGVSWTRSDGTPYALPITASSAEYAARIPPGSNLMNSPSIAVADTNHPLLTTYWSPAAGAPPQFHIVARDGTGWRATPVPQRATAFTLAGRATKRPPISRAALLTERVGNAQAVYLIYRDDARDGRIIGASTADLATLPWRETELSSGSVGAWEPSYDPEAWRRFQQVHMLVQDVTQRDGDDSDPTQVPPTAIASLVWRPRATPPDTAVDTAPPRVASAGDSAVAPGEVLTLMAKVADWQLTHPSVHHPRGWEVSPFYIGLLALDRIAPDRRYREAMLGQAEANAWEPHARPYHADDHCVIQAYLELHRQLHEPKMIDPSRRRLDGVLASPSTMTMDWDPPSSLERWTWCDALFMAPMSWLLMREATGEERYLEFMNREWWATTNRLYSPEVGFYFRDESFLDLREPNGRTIHWSRGNGWVLAGLARVLDSFPKGHRDYPRYMKLYHEMAAAALAAQQPDGLWRPGLLDPEAHPARETSGSSFLTFGLAWGVNRGHLDRARVDGALRRAWNALASCVTPEGRLEHVQPIGDAPREFDPHHSEPFGVGAFLLAGSEIHRWAGAETAKR